MKSKESAKKLVSDLNTYESGGMYTIEADDLFEMMVSFADQETAELKKAISRINLLNQQFEAENQKIRNEAISEITRLKDELFKAKGNKGVPGE